MIAILDYGMGNLKSVTNAFMSLKAPIEITRDEQVIKDAAALVVPGVGAFGKCIENLKSFKLFDLLKAQILAGKPYLGICLGMQILLEESEEAPGVEGLGIIKGRVARFRTSMKMKIPHMGWNSADIVQRPLVLKDIPSGSFFYFVHSYYPEPAENVAATTTDYGRPFVSSITKENIFASQFHPEKSQQIGLKLLRNFVNLCA